MTGNRRSALRSGVGAAVLALLLLVVVSITGQSGHQPFGRGGAGAAGEGGANLGPQVVRAAGGAGAIQGLVWDDPDADMKRGENEATLPGAVLTLTQIGGSLQLSRTTGTDGQYLFVDLESGDYQLQETDPPGYESTTPNTLIVAVQAGVTRTIDFGDRLVPTPTPTPAWGPLQHIPVACGTTYGGDTSLGLPVFQQYGCQPSWDESGPEQVFLVELAAAQTITAQLSELTADLDLFLLRGPRPMNCLAGGDYYIQHSVDAPGQYYLVVDGYQGAEGTYSLRIDCPVDSQASATPTPTKTPTATASPTPTISPTPTLTPSPTATANPFVWDIWLPLISRSWPPDWPTVTMSLQQGADGYDGVADTYISRWAPDSNFGAADQLLLRTADQFGETQSPLIYFDLTGLPVGSIVAEATLKLYIISKTNQGAPPIDVSVYGVNRYWSAGEATWTNAMVDTPWETAGCNGPEDRRLIPEAQQELSQVQIWAAWDVTGLARFWAADAASNKGLNLKATGAGQVAYSIAASDDSRRELRPRLELSYWPPSPGKQGNP